MASKHKEAWAEIVMRATTEATIVTPVTHPRLFDGLQIDTGHVQRMFEKHLIRWIADAKLSHQIVEESAFKEMIRHLNDEITIPSAAAVLKMGESLYNESKPAVLARICKEANKFSLTTNVLCLPTEEYLLEIKLHWINHDWELKEASLDMVPLIDPHDGRNTFRKFEAAFKEFLEHKSLGDLEEIPVVGLTTDETTNNDTFVGEAVQKRILQDFHAHQRCFANLLNLVARDTIKLVEGTIKKLQNHIFLVNCFDKERQRFNRVCQSFNIEPKPAVLPVEAQWTSIWEMMNQALAHQKQHHQCIIELIEEGEHHEELHISRNEWTKLASIAAFLEPFAKATKECCSNKNQAFSLVVVWHSVLLETCEKVKNGTWADNEDLQQAAEVAFQKMEKYYDVSSDNCTLAVLLDPRFNMEHYKEEDMTASAMRDEMKKKTEQIQAIFDRYSSVALTQNSSEGNPHIPTITAMSNIHPFKRRKASRSTNELVQYLSLAQIHHEKDPLQWWKANSTRFPTLAKMAQHYLAIPAVTETSKRKVAPEAGLMTGRWTGLDAETFQRNTVLRSWLVAGLVD
ncbi:hypothetical protein K3495_g5390 [Podosphaera aphanis]|nr:hypothetical protein K3495_g5390 [Podosphaera aphanis]